jgi:hypothetical protein
MVAAPYFYERIGRRYIECEVWRKAALEFVSSLKPDVVVLGSAASYPFSRTQWIEGTTQVLGAIQSAKRIYVIQATPALPFDGPACLSRRDWRAGFLTWSKDCTAPLQDSHVLEVHRWIAQAASPYPKVQMLDLNKAVCPDGRCQAERDGIVVFRDNQHLTATFAGSLNNAISASLNPISTTATPFEQGNVHHEK